MEEELIGGLIGVVLLTVGLIKIELIKSYVKKISGEKSSLIITLFIIIVISVLPILISLALPVSKPEPKPLAKKTDVEIYFDVAEDAVKLAQDMSEDMKKNKERKDSVYQVNREQRWVYKVGDIVFDKDLLLSTYKSAKALGLTNVFKTSDGGYFLFIDKHWSEEMLQDSLSLYKSELAKSHLRVKMIDLADCDVKKRLAIKKQVKIGKRKDKHYLDCYVCD